MPIWNVEAYKRPAGVITAGATEQYYMLEPCVMYRSGWKAWIHTNLVAGESTDYYTSSDGESWTRVGTALAGVYRSMVLYNADESKYWLYGTPNGTNLHLYTSSTETGFTLDTSDCITIGSSGAWDDSVIANPFVWREGPNWYMVYTANKAGSLRWLMGLATSSDGRTWTKDAANPLEVTGFDQINHTVVGMKWITPHGSGYAGFFHGKNGTPIAAEFPNDIFLAMSATTGTTIEKLRGPWAPVNGMVPLIKRVQVWEGVYSSEGQASDPFVVEKDGETFIFYEGIEVQGGNSTSPYRIGLVRLPIALITFISNGMPMSLLTGLISYWKLDEASGTALDAHGTENLTDNNTVAATTGKLNSGRQFIAANLEYLSHADDGNLSIGDIDFTLSAWVYLDSKTDNMAIVSKYGSTAEYALNYGLGPDRFQFNLVPAGGSNMLVTASAFGSPPAGQWIFVIAWYDAGADSINIQVNNGTVNTTSSVAPGPDSSSEFDIGRLVLSGGLQYWDGRIDEVGFWKRLLTSDERTSLYNGGSGLPYSDFVPAGSKRRRFLIAAA